MLMQNTNQYKSVIINLAAADVSFQALIQTCVDFGYERVDMVLEYGDFSVRGNIIDIFSVVGQSPFRIEYDVNDVYRITSFSTHDQKTVTELNKIEIEAFDATKKTHTYQRPQFTNNNIISSLFVGDYVVHEYHGLGRYEGLAHRTFGTVSGEYVTLSYKHGDVIHIPIDQLDKIHKYQQFDSTPQLNSLSDQTWKRLAKKATSDIFALAEELFQNYLKRSKQVGFKFFSDTAEQLDIEALFQHQLTPDQERAITEIKADMESAYPMDRLLCGDVGYGKTEVLFRAVLKALMNQKQVAVLVPTTILVEQHTKLFRDRLKNTPFFVESLSRFVSTKDQKMVIEKMKTQQCDLVVGTHRLLSKDIQFNDLGLLVIDEEQRFGVKHKEKIQGLRHHIDVLSVTATPIPRTLFMSLSGTRDLSSIETPPKNRKSILTIVKSHSAELVKEAVSAEIARNGQIFYVFNRVRELPQKQKELQKLFPDLSIGMVHGQMDEHQIKQIMSRFVDGSYDILLATTIIENGLDIKRANCIIIERVEEYGLSQLHQLRGRVGRSNTQAYAYFLYTPNKSINANAKQRLQAIKEYMSLGSGYNIACKDLEIRGAGSIFGSKQHGHVINIGFSYYCKLLEDAVYAKKGEANPNRYWLSADIRNIQIDSHYIDNERERVAMYQRLFKCRTIADCDDLINECQDRYGRLTQQMSDVFVYIKSEIHKHAGCS